MAALLLQVLVLFTVFRSGVNFKCYICDSKTNPNCRDPVNGNKLEVIDCEDFFPLLALQLDIDPSVMTEPLLYGCQKLEVQDSAGSHVTVRTCAAFENNSSTACEINDKFQQMEEKFTLEFCGVCEHELCNTSVKCGISSTLLFMLIALATLATLRSHN